MKHISYYNNQIVKGAGFVKLISSRILLAENRHDVGEKDFGNQHG